MARPSETINLKFVFAILIASLLLTFAFVGTLSAQELLTAETESTLPADLSITKSSSVSSATPEDTISYTIIIANDGDTASGTVTLTDTLPAELDYVMGTVMTAVGSNTVTITNTQVISDVLSWSGVIGADGIVTIELDATILSTVTIGTFITNTAAAIDGTDTISDTAIVEVVNTPPADLDITKTASSAEVEIGGTVEYTILVENNGPGAASGVEITDALPADLTYVVGTLNGTLTNATVTTPGSFSSGVLTWGGVIGNGGTVELTFEAEVSNTAEAEDIISNEAEVEWNGMSETDDVSVEVSGDYWYLPIISSPINTPSGLMASRPVMNGNNATWTLMWGSPSASATYEIQESHQSDFSSGVTTYTSTNTNEGISQPPSMDNEFYYRVRAISGGNASPWSETIVVVGAYRDDFNSARDWGIVRTSFLEKVYGFHETGDSWYVIQVDDRWDWGIASPLKQAPIPPYVIEFRSEPANIGNLLSHGAVFGGDYTGEPCIVPGTEEGAYQRTECFNHFYNTNFIMRGAADEQKLLFERIDSLAWCPDCEGSAVKRLTTDVDSNGTPRWPEIGVVPSLDDGFNTYRIEVLPNTARVYANGTFVLAYEGTNPYYNDRYFGVFASTNEYNNSTWRFDYFQVLPLE